MCVWSMCVRYPTYSHEREACELICMKSSPLFETNMAETIKTHYQETLDQMVEQRRSSQVMEQGLIDATSETS